MAEGASADCEASAYANANGAGMASIRNDVVAASTPSFSGEDENWVGSGSVAHGSTVAQPPLFPPGMIRDGDEYGSTVGVLSLPPARRHINPDITAVATGTSLLAPSYTSVDLGQAVIPPGEESYGSAHHVAPDWGS